VGEGLPVGGFGLCLPLPFVEVGDGAAVVAGAWEVTRGDVAGAAGRGAVRVGTAEGVALAGTTVAVAVGTPSVEPPPAAGWAADVDDVSQPLTGGAGKTPAIAWSRQLSPGQSATTTAVRTATAASAAATTRSRRGFGR
jgi:hypothetical protein